MISNVVGERFSPSIGDRIARVDGVASVTRIRSVRTTVAGDDTGLMAVDPANLTRSVRVSMVEGSATDLRRGTVLVTEQRATRDHLQVGDRVSMAMPDGARTYEVAGIIADNNPVLYSAFTTTLDTLTEAGFQPADNLLLVNETAGSDSGQVKAAVEAATADLPTVTVKDQEGYAAEQRGQFNQLLFLVYALLGLALLIAVLGIVNTLALSVIERTREVGLLRAIGLSRPQLRRMVRLESIVIAVLGALLGVAMGVVFGIALMASLRDEGLEVTVVPTVQLGAVVLGAAALGVLAAVFPARRAARLDVLRAIADD
jgi:putative ABC transport system permease protein